MGSIQFKCFNSDDGTTKNSCCSFSLAKKEYNYKCMESPHSGTKTKKQEIYGMLNINMSQTCGARVVR